jgi:hypothetical protein
VQIAFYSGRGTRTHYMNRRTNHPWKEAGDIPRYAISNDHCTNSLPVLIE